MAIIDPTTGHVSDFKRLVSCLCEWSSEPPILKALFLAGRADAQGLAILAQTVRATMDDQPGKMDDRGVACALMGFLVDPSVRAVVARYVSVAYSVPYDQAKKELYDFRVELTKQFHLKPSDTAVFVAKAVLVDEPTWVESYRTSEHDLGPDDVAHLRVLVDPVRSVVLAYPPQCLVRAKDEHPFPAPGELAVVSGYYEDEAGVVLRLSGAPGEDPIAEARPDWLELVATCGKVTQERVREAMEAN